MKQVTVPTFSRHDGFTVSELLVSMTIMLLVIGAALTTFRTGLDINAAAGQQADSNQNLRAGTNQLVRDLMMAGRIIAATGVPVPNGVGALAIARPSAPGGAALTFNLIADADGTIILPAITTGYQKGPTIKGSSTDLVTLLTVDEFMPVVQGIGSGAPAGLQGLVATDASQVTLPATSPWLVGDAVNDTQPIIPGDLVLFKNANGMAVQTVTSKDATHIYFAPNHAMDWFHFNQRNTGFKGTVFCIKPDPADTTKLGCDTMPVTNAVQTASFPATSLFRLLMITYYVDNVTTPSTPRLTRVINHFTPQALAGVVEDLDLTYDLVDPTNNTISNVTDLPYTASGVTYNSSMIKKVNLHMGVRSELISKPSQDYVRNHISTAVGVRSLASVDRYDTSQ